MTEKQMIRFFETALNRAIKEAGKQTAKSLKSKLISRGKSEYYERTNQIIDAFRNPPRAKIGSNGKVTFSLYDKKKIISFKGTKGSFNHHMSMNGDSKFKGVPISDLVATWQDDGYKTPNGKNIPGLNFFNEVSGNKDLGEFIIERFTEEAKEELNKIIFNKIKI